MLKKTIGVAWVCGGFVVSAANAGVDWDSKIREQLLPPTAGPTTLGVTAAQPVPMPRRDVTTALSAARSHWDELSEETRQLTRTFLQRPYPASSVVDQPGFSESNWAFGNVTETTLDSTGGHFKIHYINKDDSTYATNAKASTTSYAQTVASVLENVYSTEHGTLGYTAVPSDNGSVTNNGDTINGGDGKFDVYLTNLGPYGLYGYVAPEASSNDGARPYGEYSYMVLDNDYSLSPYGYADSTLPLKVTAAHEYFHAVQFGYSAQENSEGFAFLEQSATWMEDQVYPAIHDNYFYLGEPYVDANGNGQYDPGEVYSDRNGSASRDDGSAEYPEASLDAFDDVPTIQYGRFVWFTYMAQNYGVGIVKTIFEKCGQVPGDNMLSAINEALQGFGATLGSAYQDYATWNYDLSNYDDGTNYPLVYVDRSTTGDNFSFTSVASPSLKAWKSVGYPTQLHLSTVYSQILLPTGSISFESSGGTPALTMLVDLGNGLFRDDVVSLSGGKGSWSAPANARKVIAVVSNVATATDGMSWTLQGSGYKTTSKKKDSFFGPVGVLDVLVLLLIGGWVRGRRRYSFG